MYIIMYMVFHVSFASFTDPLLSIYVLRCYGSMMFKQWCFGSYTIIADALDDLVEIEAADRE
jgi:hypothetical protein